MSILFDAFCCKDVAVLSAEERCNTGDKTTVFEVQLHGLHRDIQGYSDNEFGKNYTSDSLIYVPIEEIEQSNELEGVDFSTRSLVNMTMEYEANRYKVERVTKLKDYSCSPCKVVGYKFELGARC